MVGVLHHMTDVNLVDIFFLLARWSIGGGSGGGEGRRAVASAESSERKTFSFPDKCNT